MCFCLLLLPQHAHGHRYQLHAIILSRSPYLAHLISASPKSGGMHSIYVPLEPYPEITDQVSCVSISSCQILTNAHTVGTIGIRCG